MSPQLFCLLLVCICIHHQSEGRFGQENPENKLNALRNCAPGSSGAINGQFQSFAGAFIGTLLGGAAPCATQDLADSVLDFIRSNGLPQACVDATVVLRQTEKNVNPFVNRNPCSKICPNAPRNQALRGLVQGFDPACNLAQFFLDNPDQKAIVDRLQIKTAVTSNNGATAAPARTSSPSNNNRALQCQMSFNACIQAAGV